jgi:hypothetical protein
MDSTQEKGKAPVNNVCTDCMKWQRFGEDCRVFWAGKKMCTMKVTTPEEWDSETFLLRR